MGVVVGWGWGAGNCHTSGECWGGGPAHFVGEGTLELVELPMMDFAAGCIAA